MNQNNIVYITSYDDSLCIHTYHQLTFALTVYFLMDCKNILLAQWSNFLMEGLTLTPVKFIFKI